MKRYPRSTYTSAYNNASSRTWYACAGKYCFVHRYVVSHRAAFFSPSHIKPNARLIDLRTISRVRAFIVNLSVPVLFSNLCVSLSLSFSLELLSWVSSSRRATWSSIFSLIEFVKKKKIEERSSVFRLGALCRMRRHIVIRRLYLSIV